MMTNSLQYFSPDLSYSLLNVPENMQLQEMDAKFQEDLKVSGAKGAAVNPEIRAQLEKIDQQLHKEKLQWLKDIHGIREQCEITGDSEPRARTGLERQVHMMRKGKTKFAQCEKLEQEQFKLHQRHLKHIEYKKKRQLIQDSQKRCDALLAAWQFEQKTFGKQAEIARLHRNILNTHYKNDKIKAQLSRQIYDSINGESDTESDDDCSYKGKTKVVNWSPRPVKSEKSDKLGKTEKAENLKTTENLAKSEKPRRRASVRFSLCDFSDAKVEHDLKATQANNKT